MENNEQINIDNEPVAPIPGEEGKNEEASAEGLGSLSTATPKEHEPHPDSKRYKEVYYNWKEAERKLDKVLSKMDQADEEREKTREAKKMQKLEEELDSAFESGDEELHLKVKQKIKALIDKKAVAPQIQQSDTSHQPPPPPQADPEMQQFVAYNPWFGVDSAKTQKAIEIDAQMKRDPIWIARPRSEFLAELANRTNQQMNRVGSNSYVDTAQAPVGGIQGDLSGAATTQAVTLTEAQKAVARRTMPDLKPEDAYSKYAKYL